MSTQPTDAEIDEFLDSPGNINWVLADKRERFRLFARAVLAKWGQPAHSGEPVECDCRNPYSHDECTQQAGCKIKTKLSRKTHQPVEREPLTDEQIHAIYDEVARREPYAGAVTRRSIVRAIEAAHGIKGGQHGTE